MIETTKDMESAAESYPAAMFSHDTVYLKIMSDGTVRALADKATVNAPMEYGGGGGSYDMEISTETWVENECIARVRDGRIFLGKTQDEKQAEWEAAIRAERDRRLRLCDKMSPMRWNVLTDAERATWAAYRQALLDIPEQEGFPWGGVVDSAPWPEIP
nr:MAG TPA: tail assembly chaperone protein [Caudoviricetes sp.]